MSEPLKDKAKRYYSDKISGLYVDLFKKKDVASAVELLREKDKETWNEYYSCNSMTLTDVRNELQANKDFCFADVVKKDE